MKSKHIHKYIRHKFNGGTVVYRCVLTGCNHYLTRDFVVGKLSLCWQCGNVFEMTKHSIRLKKPHCLSCTKGIKKDDHIRSLVEGLFK